jgi:hypothetical protein
MFCYPSFICRENERQSAPDVLVVDSAETHEVSANVTVETTTTPSSNIVKSRSQIVAEQNLINFGLAIPHDILLGELGLSFCPYLFLLQFSL